MIKSIAILGTAAALAASVTATQAAWVNGLNLNALNPNGLSTNVFIGNALNTNILIGNALIANVIIGNSIIANGRLGAASAAFIIESIEMPDGTVASY
jgi:hypothetical protein